MTRSSTPESSVAKILFSIVIVFVVCNMATTTNHMLKSFGDIEIEELTTASNFFILLNAAPNFLFYCFLSRKFRSELFNLLDFGKQTIQRNRGFETDILSLRKRISAQSANSNGTMVKVIRRIDCRSGGRSARRRRLMFNVCS